MPVWLKGPDLPQKQPQPALFIDRDGVVIADRDYLADPAGVEVLPGVAAAMKRAQAAGFVLIGISNQSGLGRGYFGMVEFEQVMARMAKDLADVGVAFDAFYYCPHGPDDACVCRKPNTGMLDEARASFNWDTTKSWVIGDKGSDVALGQNANLGSILVRTGYGLEAETAVRRRWSEAPRVAVADDLSAAVDWIIRSNENSGKAGGK